jgi:Rho GTPase-activating protein 1
MEGLLQRLPSAGLFRAAKDTYDGGNVVSLDTFGDLHLAAVLQKKYLRKLQEPNFPESLYGANKKCPPLTSDPADVLAVAYVREMFLTELPPCSYSLLSHVLCESSFYFRAVGSLSLKFE